MRFKWDNGFYLPGGVGFSVSLLNSISYNWLPGLGWDRLTGLRCCGSIGYGIGKGKLICFACGGGKWGLGWAASLADWEIGLWGYYRLVAGRSGRRWGIVPRSFSEGGGGGLMGG